MESQLLLWLWSNQRNGRTKYILWCKVKKGWWSHRTERWLSQPRCYSPRRAVGWWINGPIKAETEQLLMMNEKQKEKHSLRYTGEKLAWWRRCSRKYGVDVTNRPNVELVNICSQDWGQCHLSDQSGDGRGACRGSWPLCIGAAMAAVENHLLAGLQALDTLGRSRADGWHVPII